MRGIHHLGQTWVVSICRGLWTWKYTLAGTTRATSLTHGDSVALFGQGVASSFYFAVASCLVPSWAEFHFFMFSWIVNSWLFWCELGYEISLGSEAFLRGLHEVLAEKHVLFWGAFRFVCRQTRLEKYLPMHWFPAGLAAILPRSIWICSYTGVWFPRIFWQQHQKQLLLQGSFLFDYLCLLESQLVSSCIISSTWLSFSLPALMTAPGQCGSRSFSLGTCPLWKASWTSLLVQAPVISLSGGAIATAG